MEEDKNFESMRRKANITTLRFVLALIIIGLAMNSISELMLGIFHPKIAAIYESGALNFPEMYKVAFENTLEIPRLCDILDGILSVVALIGAILMWNLKRTGFHLYAIGKLLIIAVAILFLGKANVQLGNIMMTFLLIAFFFYTLKSLNVFGETEKKEDTDSNLQE